MFSLVVFKRRRWLRSRRIAEKYVGHARTLMSSQDSADVFAAVSLLDAALKLCPQWEKALELKAKSLLRLRRFRDVTAMLHDYIPSAKSQCEKASTPPDSPVFGKDRVQLLANWATAAEEPRPSSSSSSKKKSLLKYLVASKIRKILVSSLSRRCERSEWRYVVLGQACCHLGMMEDAMILLQHGKKAACAAFRRESIGMGEDTFCCDAFAGPDSDFVTHLLGNIKFLIRRRAAALAAMEAGLYQEAVRHFSKILEGRRGSPQGFIAECYLYRALAHKANGRVPDAIADCNRTLCLDPGCAPALSLRAALYEMVRCFYESLQDLKQLKFLYDALAQQQRLPRSAWRLPQTAGGDYAGDYDAPGSIHQLDFKIGAVKQRLESRYTIDYHTILGLTNRCTKAEVERAHLLICLKHRPDKASHFVDRCEFVDERDPETVKEEARLAATRLFRLIQNAHSGVMHILLEEDGVRRRAVAAAAAAQVRGHEPGNVVGRARAEEVGKAEERTSEPCRFQCSATDGGEQATNSAAPCSTDASVAPMWPPPREEFVTDARMVGPGRDIQVSEDPTFRPRVDEGEQLAGEPAPPAEIVESALASGPGAVPSVNSHASDVGCSVADASTASAHSSHSCQGAGDGISANSETDGNSCSPAPVHYRDMVAVESKLAMVLSPSNWMKSGESSNTWFQNHHTAMPVHVS